MCQVQDQAQLQGRSVTIAVLADDGAAFFLGPFQSFLDWSFEFFDEALALLGVHKHDLFVEVPEERVGCKL